MRVDLTPPDWARFLQSDLTDWQRAPLPVADVAPFEIPDDAYFEYCWVDAGGERRPDPDNPNPILNPWWDFASNIAGPEYRPDPDVVPEGVGPRGRVLRMHVESAIQERTRHVLVYSPAGMTEAGLPLLLFNDGKAYFGWGRAPQVMDRLLARGEIEPAHLVFVPPAERTKEYAFNPDYRAFLTDELLPAVEARIRCDGRRTVWGASLGGLLGVGDLGVAGVGVHVVHAEDGGAGFCEVGEGGEPEEFLRLIDAAHEWVAAEDPKKVPLDPQEAARSRHDAGPGLHDPRCGLLLAVLAAARRPSLGDWFTRLMSTWLGPFGLVVVEPRMMRRLAAPVLALEHFVVDRRFRVAIDAGVAARRDGVDRRGLSPGASRGRRASAPGTLASGCGSGQRDQ